jgi:hypothetical protein
MSGDPSDPFSLNGFTGRVVFGASDPFIKRVTSGSRLNGSQ